MDGLILEELDVVRRQIATLWLEAEAVDVRLGAVELRPHQLDAVRRIQALLLRGGGALLCDDVGLGKTYVALAVARMRSWPLVVAPASLRAMWLNAARRAGRTITFLSTESLSRGAAPGGQHDLVIVDEAHHFRTASTRRYQSLAFLCARTPILLMSATPLHNRRGDLSSLLALFLGSAAATLTDHEAAGYLIRRSEVGAGCDVPKIRAPVRFPVCDNSGLLDELLALPPPAPARDGVAASALILHSLTRLWASSDAALKEGIRRRLARTIALRQALEAGRHPTKRELERWTYAEGAVQLGFPSFLAEPSAGTSAEHVQFAINHERALTMLLSRLGAESQADAGRLERLLQIRRAHPGERIIAFSQFAETVRMYYRGLSGESAVAMLTSRGARIASGQISRPEALARFAPEATRSSLPRASEFIGLLITTDLLSEGVNLQDASVVVHLDLPWTAATLDQRVGRVARLGSHHAHVSVYALDPPAASDRLLRAEAIIQRKLELAEATLGPSRLPALFARLRPASRSAIGGAEIIRELLAKWKSAEVSPGGVPACGFVAADRDGIVALVRAEGRTALVAGCGSSLTEDIAVVQGMVEAACGAPSAPDAHLMSRAVAAFYRWADREIAWNDAGLSGTGLGHLARRVTQRLACELASSPLHNRGPMAARIAAAQARLSSRLTLAVEWELRDALASKDADLLDEIERILGAGTSVRSAAPPELCALLVLRCG